MDAMKKGRWKCGPRDGEHNGASKLTWADVREIREKAGEGISQSILAKEYSVTVANIWLILKGIHWKDPRKE